MPSDYRLKYLAGQIANTDSIDNIDNIPISNESTTTPDAPGLYQTARRNNYYEPFEGGIHRDNARMLFLSFAAIIMVLYVLES